MRFLVIRYLTVIICLFSLFAYTAKAQVGEYRNQFYIGANGGVNINKASFIPSVRQTTDIASNAGVSFRYINEKYFAMISGVHIEVNYSQKGWSELFEKLNDSGEPVKDKSKEYKRRANYIEIPMLAHLAFGKDDGFQFFIHAGPQIGFLLSESESIRNVDITNLSVTQREIYGNKLQQKFDYGISGGLGIELNSRKAGTFSLEGRYYFGLSDFYRTTKKDFFGRAAHSTISIKLNYLFRLN